MATRMPTSRTARGRVKRALIASSSADCHRNVPNTRFVARFRSAADNLLIDAWYSNPSLRFWSRSIARRTSKAAFRAGATPFIRAVRHCGPDDHAQNLRQASVSCPQAGLPKAPVVCSCRNQQTGGHDPSAYGREGFPLRAVPWASYGEKQVSYHGIAYKFPATAESHASGYKFQWPGARSQSVHLLASEQEQAWPCF